jgi:hypothetical protein
MKKRFLILFVLSFLGVISFAQTQKTVRVKNTEDFINAIASNTIIELEYGLYLLDNYVTDGYVSEDNYGQTAFYLENISNLTLRGVGQFPSELVVSNNELATVLYLKDCKSIRLENLEIGHGASKGSCIGAVIGLYNTQDISIKNCVLYGSGTYGIECVAQSQGLVCENTTIRSCTYGALALTTMYGATFNKCTFTDNSSLDIFYINNCTDVVFNSCIIKDNTNWGLGEYAQYSFNKLFAVEGEAVTLNKCLVKFNRVDFLANSKSAIINNNSLIEFNNYAKKMYENEP